MKITSRIFASIFVTLVIAGIVSAQDQLGGEGPPILQVAESDVFGEYIVGPEGRALYTFTGDTGDTIACVGECAEVWLPVTEEAVQVAKNYFGGGEGVETSLIGTIIRPDGAAQVTYGGFPLYWFAPEAETPGRTDGQGVEGFGGTWHLVSPAAELITITDDGS